VHRCSKPSVVRQDRILTHSKQELQNICEMYGCVFRVFHSGVIEGSIVMQCIIPEEWNPLVIQSLRQGGEPHVGNNINQE